MRSGSSSKEADTWADRAIEDLMQCSATPLGGFLENLIADIAPDKDFGWLNQVREEKVKQVRKRLGDTTLP